MAQYITEVLKELNDDPSLFQTTYRKVGDGGPLGMLFKHAFLPESKFLLPEGDPPYKADTSPIGMTRARFIQEIRKFYVFCRKDLTPMKRETMFVQLCEALHPDEVKILCAIKDQQLTKLYPRLTRKVIADAGFLPPLTEAQEKAEVAEVKKSGRPRGRPPKSASPQPVL